MDKMKPWNKGFIQQRSFNMAQPKDTQTLTMERPATQTQTLERTHTLERPASQQSDSDGWGIGPQHTLINPGSWGQPIIGAISPLEEVFYTSYVEGSSMTMEQAMEFLQGDMAPGDIHEGLVRRLVERITVYDDCLAFEFKSGLETEVQM